jgi:serine/threonine protein kinase
MAIICPYCSHQMNPKGVRPGHFTPKCAKCGRSFKLSVAADGDSFSFKSSPLPGQPQQGHPFDPNVTTSPGETAPPPAARAPANLDVTAPEVVSAVASRRADPVPTLPPGGEGGGDADFSLAASAVKPVPAALNDATMALNETSQPRPAVNLDATEASDSDPGAAAGDKDSSQVPNVLGGYQVIKELGRGGMGAVYLARQISLDRPVALKVMNAEWASNPNFLVRFTREAYAAAQLVHHNVVQVYDIGADKGVNYFSMEFVEGCSLGDLLKKEKRVAADVASGYILQAARGLKFAHDRGMIHRDIKPDNLMLNNQGVVKVADLGLVRTPGMEDDKLPASAPPDKGGARQSLSSLSNVTLAGQSMGTPSYMAPEQARDATRVDHRADVYSLGCTLFVMVTGRPVFSASTPLEMMTKHATEPVVPPHQVVKDVPKALSDVVVKMLAKKPDDRYPAMDEVIKALEDFLGLQGKGKESQTEQHVRTLEQGVKGFLEASAAQLRSWVLLGFFGGCAALFLLLLLFGAWRFSGAALSLGLLTAVSYLIIHGASQRTHLFLKFRDLALSSSWLELGKVVLGVLLLLILLGLLGRFDVLLLTGLLSVGLALGMHYALDRKIAKERTRAVEKVEKMLRTLRLRGLSEEALHEFVSKYAGEHWEEFFEALFGYEAKLTARLRYGVGPRGARPRYAAWRDPVVRWIDSTQRRRQEARERKHLQAIEQKNFEAQGVDAAQAKQQAEAVAGAMVQKAAEMKKEEALPALEQTVAPEKGVDVTTPNRPPPPRRVNLQDMLTVSAAPTKAPPRGRVIGELFEGIFSGSVRFLIGATLLVICLVWLHKNGLLPSSTTFDDKETYASIWERMKDAKPLEWPMPQVFRDMFSSINPGAAGLLLVLSALWRSWKIGFLTLAGAAIMVIGPVTGMVPALGMTTALVSLGAGSLVMLLGFLYGRDT